MILKILLAGLITLLANLILVTIQHYYQLSHMPEDFFIHLGFPFEFFYFRPDLGLHGFRMNHFIYDSFIWFGFSFLIVLALSYFRKERKNNKGEVIDIID